MMGIYSRKLEMEVNEGNSGLSTDGIKTYNNRSPSVKIKVTPKQFDHRPSKFFFEVVEWGFEQGFISRKIFLLKLLVKGLEQGEFDEDLLYEVYVAGADRKQWSDFTAFRLPFKAALNDAFLKRNIQARFKEFRELTEGNGNGLE